MTVHDRFSVSSGDTRRARIRFLEAHEGGRSAAPVSGVRSQLVVGDIQTSCVVFSADGRSELPLGEEIEVDIHALLHQFVAEEFAGVTDVALYEGNKLVALGHMIDRE